MRQRLNPKELLSLLYDDDIEADVVHHAVFMMTLDRYLEIRRPDRRHRCPVHHPTVRRVFILDSDQLHVLTRVGVDSTKAAERDDGKARSAGSLNLDCAARR